MIGKMWLGRSVLWTGLVVLGACTGSVDGAGTSTEDSGESSQLVARKKQWLETYDRYCAGCFQAFETCQQEAAEASESVDCKAQLDACMRDGLVKDDADADADQADDDEDADASADDDADVADDPDANVDDNDADAGANQDDADADEEDADAGADEDDDDADADADAGAEDDGEDDAAVDDDGGDEEEAAQDAIKTQLIEDIGICLEEVGSCLQTQPDDARPCLREVKVCVREALTVAFNAVCGDEVALAEEENASKERVQGLQLQCAEQLVTTLLD